MEEKLLEDALKSGATALFTEKYEDRVRVINIGGFYSEICGGTHLDNVFDIMLFKITSFSSIGKNLKRIEAVTYTEAISYLENYRKIVSDISEKCEAEPANLLHRINNLLNESKEKDKVIEKYENTLSDMISDMLISEKEFVSNGINRYNYISKKLALNNIEIISKIADRVVSSLDDSILFIADEVKDKIFFVIKVGENVKGIYPAVKLVKEVSSILGGGGGGSDIFARGSGKNKDRFNEAAEKIKGLLQSKGLEE
jgi:alanyl-tRNA synthetase